MKPIMQNITATRQRNSTKTIKTNDLRARTTTKTAAAATAATRAQTITGTKTAAAATAATRAQTITGTKTTRSGTKTTREADPRIQLMPLDKAIVSNDAAKALSLLQDMTTDERRLAASHKKRMQTLAKLEADDDVKACMDLLYEYVNDATVLQTFVEKRYGVKLSSETVRGTLFRLLCLGNMEDKEWTVNGARHVYYSLGLLPKGHVDKICSIMTLDTEGSVCGASRGDMGCCFVNYDDSNTEQETGSGCCDSGDYMYSLNALDTTIVHEIGHIVDTGKKYSGRKDFRAISDWKSEGKSPTKIVEAIESYAATPYPDTLTKEEIDIAHEGAKLLVENRVVGTTKGEPIPEKILPVVQKAYQNLGKRGGKEAKILDKAIDWVKGNRDDNDYRDASELTTALIDSTVYKHIARSFTYSYETSNGKKTTYLPCYIGANDEMRRQIHEGYEGRGWYSFANAAWQKKISKYQFRDPGEEFAELYAAYHVANPKGSKTSDAHNEWFERMGLHKTTPQKVQGRSGKF